MSKPLGPEYEILVELHKRDQRLEAEARDPWRAFLASASNFIIFTVFGLAVISGLAVIIYVAIDLLRR